VKNKTKTLWIVLSIALLLTVSVGSTLAYLITSSEDVENTFTPSYVKCEIGEKFVEPETLYQDQVEGDKVKSDVYVTNKGNIDAYIRAAVVVTWKSEANGSVYGGGAPVEGTDYKIDYNEADWTYNSTEKFWYCNASVAPEGNTDNLIEHCYQVAGKAPAGYGLNVEILAQAIQKDGIGANDAQTAFANAKK